MPKEPIIYSEHTPRYALLSRSGKLFIWLVEKIIALFTPNQYIFNTTDFKWVAEIERNHKGILKEFIAFYNKMERNIPDIAEISEEQQKVVNENQWHFIPFYIYGHKIDSYSREFPFTTSVIAGIPKFTTIFFSILSPRTHVAEHRGAFKGYLRYHLGVKIPQPENQCGLRIENNIFNWYNGKSIIFDDTYKHSVWNESDNIRVVLYVDFIRPMPGWLQLLSSVITKLISRSPYIKNALIKLNRMEQAEHLTKLLG